MASTHPSYDIKALTGIFEELRPLFRAAIGKTTIGPKTDSVMAAAAKDFAALAPDVPYIGDLQYPLPRTLAEGAVALSFYRVMRQAGLATEAAGGVILSVSETAIRATPPEELRAQGEGQFTEDWYRLQEFSARESQKRRSPADWVYEYVPGKPGEFDWGWDFTECGICKFYHKHGAPELVPYQCKLDFVVSRYQGTGLARTRTLADGADRCDFRYQKGRPVS